jgi:hypothetical protein
MSRSVALLRATLAMAVWACGPSAAQSDAAVDVPTSDAGPCGADVLFTGELTDWSSSDTDFCGIFQAKWQVRGDPTRTKTTSPNGRFELCIAPAATTQIDVTPPSDPSPCRAKPGSYTFPGIAIANQAVISSGALFSARSITTEAIQAAGLTLSPAKAQVLVRVTGTARQVTSAAPHDPPLAFNGATWAPGDTGVYVYFPNTDATTGSTTISTPAATSLGAGTAPVVAATFTYVTIVPR